MIAWLIVAALYAVVTLWILSTTLLASDDCAMAGAAEEFGIEFKSLKRFLAIGSWLWPVLVTFMMVRFMRLLTSERK